MLLNQIVKQVHVIIIFLPSNYDEVYKKYINNIKKNLSALL